MKVVSSKKAKKLSTKKKRILNVDELNAYKVAYGKPLGTRDYIYYVLGPAAVFGAFSFLILYYWWVSVGMAILGAIYGAKVFLPKSIQKTYNSHSFGQRNKFINNMTQILTDDSKTVPKALSLAKARSEGEFKEEVGKLEGRLMGADTKQINKGIENLIKKYEDDVIFVQYMEQLETALIEGRANIDTLKDIKSYHNDMKKKQFEYDIKKQGHLKDMKMLCGVMVIFVLAISFSFGFSTYINDFTRHPIGWVSGGVYMLLLMHFFRKFSVYLFDDSILEVKL